MPDDAAARKRRSRAHKAGDHTLCLPGRCAAAVAPDTPVAEVAPPDGAGLPGAVVAAVEEWADALVLQPGDPRGPLLAAARTLAGHLDDGRDPAAIGRELRTVVAWIAEADQGDQLDELRAARASRRVDLLLRGTG